MGNNCSELSPRPHEVCLIQHPYQLEQYNKYLDSQNIFLISPTALIINNNDANNNNQSPQTENNAQCSNNNNNKDSSSILIELNPPSTSSPHDDANANADVDVDAVEVEIDDSHISSSIPKDDTKETPIQDSNKKRKKRNSINNNNNNNLFTKLLTKKPITNLGMASNIAFAKMLAKHKNKVSNKQLKLQKKSKTCQNIKKPNIIQPLNPNINNYNTNTNNNNDNMSKSKYKASTPNLLDVITNAIESVSNKNIITSDITAEVGKSYLNTLPNKDNNNNNNNSNNRKEQCIISNKELVTNLSNINSSLGEMNESSVSDVLPLTNQLKINYNITNNISYQAETFQITPSSEYVANKSKMHQIENEMQFTLMHACSHRMKQRIELLQQFSINNEVNHNENIFVKEDSFIHNHNKQNENFVKKVSQLLSLDKNNQLVFHKLNSEQSIQFSILESSTKANTNTNTNTNTQSVKQLKKELEIPLRTQTEPLTPCVHNTFHSKLSFNPRSITHLHLMKQQHTTNESNKTSNRISGANCSSDMDENNERDETETITEFNNRTSVLNASCHILSIGGANGNNVKGSRKINKHIKERRKRDKLLTKNTFLKEVVLSSELKKVNVVNDKVSYANRFCVLTEAELKTFKSREEFVLVKPPLLVIALASVVNVNGGVSVDNVNANTNGNGGSNNKMQGKDKMHYFMVKYKKGKGENSGGNMGNEVEGVEKNKDENNSNNKEGVVDIEVEYFGTADVKLMKEWVKEIKFSIDNVNVNTNMNH